jgi:hypothetical protein
MVTTRPPRVPATAILFDRVEGPVHACRAVRFQVGLTYPTAEEAWYAVEHHIDCERVSAPNKGGYDKCDVVVAFAHDASLEESPVVYRTRYDMVGRLGAGHPGTLAEMLTREVLFYGGLWRPAHITDYQYKSLLVGLCGNAEGHARRRRLAERLDIPGLADAYERALAGPLGGGRG